MTELSTIRLSDFLIARHDWQYSDFLCADDGSLALSICDHFAEDKAAFNPYALFFDKFKVTLEEAFTPVAALEIRQFPNGAFSEISSLIGERLSVLGFRSGLVGVQRRNRQVLGLPALAFAHADHVFLHAEDQKGLQELTSIAQSYRHTTPQLVRPKEASQHSARRCGAAVTFDGRTDDNAVIGYEASLQTFFLQAFESVIQMGDEEVEFPLIWFGRTSGEIPTLTFLRQIAAAQGVSFELMDITADRQWEAQLLLQEA